jgi:hypothetical protein
MSKTAVSAKRPPSMRTVPHSDRVARSTAQASRDPRITRGAASARTTSVAPAIASATATRFGHFRTRGEL